MSTQNTFARRTFRRGLVVSLAVFAAGTFGGVASAQADTPMTGTAAETATTLNATASGPSSFDLQLLSLINNARLHPEQYPPTGANLGEATMTSCPTELRSSASLWRAAERHDKFIGSQTKEWLTRTTPDGTSFAHVNADGLLSGANGGSISRAGYNTWRAEIVAMGQKSAADAVRDWMQNDGGSHWGHRDIILDCKLTNAGADKYVGGPWGYYYTMDAGKP